MNVRAKISTGYLVRLFILAAMFTGFGAWFIYDGAVGYPEENRQHQVKVDAFLEEVNGVPRKDLAPSHEESWENHAKAQGWDTKEPDVTGPPHGKWDIRGQFGFAALTLPIGLLFLFSLVRGAGRWVELDGDVLRTSSGHEVKISEITELDEARWRAKGIAFARFQKEGRTQSILLDDWKFDRDATTQIVEHLEQQIDQDKITRPPEPVDQVESVPDGQVDGAAESSADPTDPTGSSSR